MSLKRAGATSAAAAFDCCMCRPSLPAEAMPLDCVRALATADVGLENGPAVAVFGNLVVNVSTRHLSFSCVRALHTS